MKVNHIPPPPLDENENEITMDYLFLENQPVLLELIQKKLLGLNQEEPDGVKRKRKDSDADENNNQNKRNRTGVEHSRVKPIKVLSTIIHLKRLGRGQSVVIEEEEDDDDEVEIVQGGTYNTIKKLLLKHPELQSQPLTPVEFMLKRSQNKKPPHIFSIHLPPSREITSDAKLLSLDPFDRKNVLCKELASHGVNVDLATFGEGSLLDAVTFLGNHQEPTVRYVSTLSISINSINKEIEFQLHLEVSLLPAFYYSPPTNSKRILLDHLFPTPSSTIPPVTKSRNKKEVPASINVDFFYSDLSRAPRTSKSTGLPVPIVLQPIHIEIKETKEEKKARERRELKGKGKAVDQNNGGSGKDNFRAQEIDGGAMEEEDELLKPKGLKATLMPFQSRSVRWLLFREGKYVKPNESKVVEIVNGNGTGVDEMEVDEEEEVQMNDDGEEEEKEIVLLDLPEETLRLTRRGPFWEKVSLKLPDFDDEGNEGVKEFWLSRIGTDFRIDDPADAEEVYIEDEEEDKDKDEDTDDDVMIVDEQGKAKEKKKPIIERSKPESRGHGLLSDEMGCGKTIEIISLILLHRQPERNMRPPYKDLETDAMVQPTDLTLIVAPAAIVSQWATELQKHSPSLRVLRYEAITKLDQWYTPLRIAKEYDIILTTFDVLRKEVAISRKPHERATRNKSKKVQYKRSLLVQIDFLRCILDEAQMVGDNVSTVSETASLIPRLHSFAVTGTPLRGSVEDLQGILKFLTIEPAGSYRSVFNRLLQDKQAFIKLCQDFGVRTLKSQVGHELFIPTQERFVVPVTFSAVEQYYYDRSYDNALRSIGLDEDGTPTGMVFDKEANWDPDAGVMNRWLVSLRQLCCHPQIGERNKRVLGVTIKTVEAVLDTMVDLSVTELQTAQRLYWNARIKRGQLLLWDKEDCEGLEKGLKLFKEASQALEPIIQEVAQTFRDTYRARKTLGRGRAQSIEADDKAGMGATLALGFEEDRMKEDEGIPITEKERTAVVKLSALRNRLRELLFTQHSARFFSAIAYVNLGKFKTKEDEEYHAAEKIRLDLLTPWEKAVTRSIEKLKEQMKAREELDLDDLEFPLNVQGHGLICAGTFEEIDVTTDILNGLAELIFQWRDLIFQMLYTTVSISDDNGAATGEEYEERAALQEKCDVYIEAYGVLLADWRTALNGDKSALGEAAEREAWGLNKKKNHQVDGMRRARQTDAIKKRDLLLYNDAPTLETGALPADILRYELLMERLSVRGDIEKMKLAEVEAKKRKARKTRARAIERAKNLEKKKLKEKEKAMRKAAEEGVEFEDEDEDEFVADPDDFIAEESDEEPSIPEITPILTLIQQLRDASDEAARNEELALIEMESKRLKKQFALKDAIFDRLNKELQDMTTAFNSRLKYFAQLQTVSDEVADPDFRHFRGFEHGFRSMMEKERQMEKEIAQLVSNRRYLSNIQNEDDGEESSVCIICSDDFTQGVLTCCGHIFCSSCFHAWQARNRSCAVCKRQINHGDYQTVKYKRKLLVAPGERLGGGEDEIEPDKEIEVHEFDAAEDLNQISEEELTAIGNVESLNPLSSKSDLIVRHVKLIRRNDPTAKIVIFSAWVESLSILMEAFTRNKIGYVRLEGAGKKDIIVNQFIEDPSIAAFFLHTKSQSAGLNLVCAQYVFLVEPLLHPSLELQAAGRIHRMGQTKNTTVFQYYISDTVDQRVAELRARLGSSLFLRSAHSSTARDSRLSEEDMGAKSSAEKTSEEALNDEDEISRCLLSPEHFMALQQSLLPPSLRNEKILFTLQDRAAQAADNRMKNKSIVFAPPVDPVPDPAPAPVPGPAPVPFVARQHPRVMQAAKYIPSWEHRNR